MAQIPKSGLVKGPYKSTCRNCATDFSTTGTWSLHCFWLVNPTSEVAKEALECFKDAGAPPHDAVARRPATQEVVVFFPRRPTKRANLSWLMGCIFSKRTRNWAFPKNSWAFGAKALAQSLITRLQSRAPVRSAAPVDAVAAPGAAGQAPPTGAAAAPSVPKPAAIDKMTLPLPERATFRQGWSVFYLVRRVWGMCFHSFRVSGKFKAIPRPKVCNESYLKAFTTVEAGFLQ